MNIQKSGYLSIEQLTDRYLGTTRKTENHGTTDGLSFQDIFCLLYTSDAADEL